MPATSTLEDQEGQRIKRRWDNSPVNADHSLIAQARQGSVAAIGDLVERYEARIFRLASNITGNNEDAAKCPSIIRKIRSTVPHLRLKRKASRRIHHRARSARGVWPSGRLTGNSEVDRNEGSRRITFRVAEQTGS